MTNGRRAPVVRILNLTHRYGSICAIDNQTLEIPTACVVGVIGPDGVGKSSLLGLIAGARQIQAGEVAVLDGDMRTAKHRDAVCPRIAYMPQGLGKNLYADLTVRENLEFFGRVFGQQRRERERRMIHLLRSTGLEPFEDRPVKKLSGGMRQKLGLCCALIHDPDLLILDEPTTGVDPLSRRQFWDLIKTIRQRRPQMSVLIATAYMEEAEQFDHLIAMNAGRVLATGSPTELKEYSGATTIEDTFIALLPEFLRAGHTRLSVPPRRSADHDTVITAHQLTCQFGDFTAVDNVSFSIHRGEIFGFLGPNGCGKTTTMKMLTGLQPATSGQAFLLGKPIDATDLRARARVGYMSQSFSLYTELTVRQNLDLHARVFQLERESARMRIAALAKRFALESYLDQVTDQLPLGIRQRLSLAIAIVHEPELLILDEPTSGVDPLARDQFWELLIELAREQNVTIFVSTHFMNEAARCDRIALMNQGRVLAIGSPEAVIQQRGTSTLEAAFISYLEEELTSPTSSQTVPAGSSTSFAQTLPAAIGTPNVSPSFSWRRMLAFSIRETLELLRDPIRMSFALLGSAALMLIFGFGITTDVDSLSFAALDRDQTPESRIYLGELRGSRYFVEKPPIADYADLDRRLRSGDIKVSIEIPPGFGRDLKRGRPTSIGVWIDGAMPFRAETIRGYLMGVHQQYLADAAIHRIPTREAQSAADVEVRFRYNQDFKSVYAMVPGTMALLLAFIPAILMAVAVVREKELGSIINLYVTPATRIEFLLGKQLPYIGISMVNFLALFLMALFVFDVPLKGSFPTLAVGAVLYTTTTTSYGMLISSFARTQIAALFGTAILTVIPATQFSGMLTPVSSLEGVGAIIGQLFPMTYFLKISVGTFTKGLGFHDLTASLSALAVTVPVLTFASLALFRNQGR